MNLAFQTNCLASAIGGVHFLGPLGHHFGLGVAPLFHQLVELVDQFRQLGIGLDPFAAANFDLVEHFLVLLVELDLAAVLFDELVELFLAGVDAPQQNRLQIVVDVGGFHRGPQLGDDLGRLLGILLGDLAGGVLLPGNFGRELLVEQLLSGRGAVGEDFGRGLATAGRGR